MNDTYVGSREVSNHVVSVIQRLSPRDGELTSASRANLAHLRRGLGKVPGADSDSLAIALGGLRVPTDAGDNLTKAEVAAYLALTCFGAHQQSRGESMHRPGVPVGSAVRQLAAATAREASIASSYETSAWVALQKLCATRNVAMMSMHLRNIIQRLRAEKIGLDYAQLTRDLYQLQYSSSAKDVALRWTRDFNRSTSNSTADGESTTSNPVKD